MYHVLLRDASFWDFLFQVDKQLAEAACQAGCPCGGRLHRANYPRNPRGGCANLPESYRHRLSFCCERDGCRKRTTPPSVRFLGRKVFLGAVVVLVAAMRQGPSPRRVRELTELFDVDRRTIARWCIFWREHFPQTAFWRVARGRSCRVCPSPTCPARCWRRSSIARIPARTGKTSCDFSLRSRSAGAWRSRESPEKFRPAEDARRASERSRLYLVSQLFFPFVYSICEEL